MRLNLKSPDKSSGLCFICGLLNASQNENLCQRFSIELIIPESLD
jgi:hypothetical protein